MLKTVHQTTSPKAHLSTMLNSKLFLTASTLAIIISIFLSLGFRPINRSGHDWAAEVVLINGCARELLILVLLMVRARTRLFRLVGLLSWLRMKEGGLISLSLRRTGEPFDIEAIFCALVKMVYLRHVKASTQTHDRRRVRQN